MAISFEPIAVLHSVFKDKFGIPRQQGLIPEAHGVIKFKSHPFMVQALAGIAEFSHIWVVFVFHKTGSKDWKPSVRPPRLGGAKRVGVLASRSPHRPNPIGLSVLKIESVDLRAKGGPEIGVSGVDVLDGTPVLDIKPYLPYADALPRAKAGWAREKIIRVPVKFERQALADLRARGSHGPAFKKLIKSILSLDPRPAFQKRKLPTGSVASHGKGFGIMIDDVDVKWRIENGAFVVTGLEKPRIRS